MIAGKPLWMFQCRSNGRHRERRGVAGQHGRGADNGFQLGEQGLLGIEPLDNRFNDQVAVGQIAQRAGHQKPGFVTA